jgi:hypothetical protein
MISIGDTLQDEIAVSQSSTVHGLVHGLTTQESQEASMRTHRLPMFKFIMSFS